VVGFQNPSGLFVLCSRGLHSKLVVQRSCVGDDMLGFIVVDWQFEHCLVALRPGGGLDSELLVGFWRVNLRFLVIGRNLIEFWGNKVRDLEVSRS
jgi:hypothetical protein